MKENLLKIEFHDYLVRLLTQLQQDFLDGLRVQFIFDLDSTLFNVNPRSQKIVSEFVDNPEILKKYPLELSRLKNVPLLESDWGITELAQRAQIIDVEFINKLKTFWAERFFSNEYLVYDIPYEGAVRFVNEVRNAHSHIAYLTGRDRIRMGPGTEKVLRHWDFPLQENRIDLLLKPAPQINDIEYKVESLKKLSDSFDRVYFFENEPAIIHAVESEISKVQIVYMDSVHSGKAQPLAYWPFLNKSFLKS